MVALDPSVVPDPVMPTVVPCCPSLAVPPVGSVSLHPLMMITRGGWVGLEATSPSTTRWGWAGASVGWGGMMRGVS